MPKRSLRSGLWHHGHAAWSTLCELLYSPFSFLMTTWVIAMTLVLPAGLYLALKSVHPLKTTVSEFNQLTVFTQLDLSKRHVSRLKEQLQRNPNIERIDYISPHAALQEFKAHAQFDTALNALKNNPLPGVFIVYPHTTFQKPEQLKRLAQQIRRLPHIETVQVDLSSVERLSTTLHLADRLLLALIIFFGLAVAMIIYNTLRLTLHHRQKEIEVMHMLGANQRFIRRPFLYLGFWYGLFGGVWCLIILSAFYAWLHQPLAFLYQANPHHTFTLALHPEELVYFLLTAIGIGILSSYFTVRHVLRPLQ